MRNYLLKGGLAASLVWPIGVSWAQEFGLGLDYGQPSSAPSYDLGVDTHLPEPSFEPSVPPATFPEPSLELPPVYFPEPVAPIAPPDIQPFGIPYPDPHAPGVLGGVKAGDTSIWGIIKDAPKGPEGSINIKTKIPGS